MTVNKMMNAQWVRSVIGKVSAMRPNAMLKTVLHQDAVRMINASVAKIVTSRIVHHLTNAATTCVFKTKPQTSAPLMEIVRGRTNAL